MESLIRNMDERIILREEAFFDGDYCHTCKFYSPHGVFIASQKIVKKSTEFTGVKLLDILDHPILIKHYEVDPQSGEFSTLLTEIWTHGN